MRQHNAGQPVRQGAGSLAATAERGLTTAAKAPGTEGILFERGPCKNPSGENGFLSVSIGSQATATPHVFCDSRRALTAFRRCACDSRNE